MQHKRILMACWLCFAVILTTHAQESKSLSEVDIYSLQLYNASDWKGLLQYGKEQIALHVEFPLLRMRTGYAAYMLGNFSQSLIHYTKVFEDDRENNIALYYVYLNHLYLNNTSASRYYAGRLPQETKTSEKISSTKISGVNGEYSYKIPDEASRGNATYGRIGLNTQVGYRTEVQVSGALFNQHLSEPALTGVVNNRNINNNQKEFYSKFTFAATGSVSLLAGYHYIYTPFNNLIYNNHLVFTGIRITSPYVHTKFMAAFGNMTNKTYNQYDLTISTFPLGNTNLYTISRAAYGDALTYSQVAGYRVAKPLWLEGNITLGRYNNLLENDALYVFNDIDSKRFKIGGSAYIAITPKSLLSFNYTFDQKLRYGTTGNYFNQHSLNTALSWKF